MGSQAIRGVTDDASPGARERKIGAAVLVGVLGLGLLAARHSRLVAWPHGAADILADRLRLLSAALRGSSEEDTVQDAPPR
ncbi:MAG: hypothetical protein AVDCRST_MAG37-2551 [uncultured Rubrobacteraceae bacterium]|uniref:Uncharacterized protein n=1 Tax=uncultured Rubrobacteraceae bacterium TaxID=349277 RepID=A0A6J4QUU0_9ACTN|nr:MAG: hypothetical protein AVDCRST_MAG37-2551 [uncultured Rubrobacteraceae bacterium]